MYRCVVSVLLATACVLLGPTEGVPRYRRSTDDPVLAPHDPLAVAEGLHRPLAVLCPSVDITDDVINELSSRQSSRRSSGSSCGPKCEFDSECQKGQLCCSNVCGGRSCVAPLKSTQGQQGSASSVSSSIFEEKAGSGNDKFCGRYICSNKETCLSVAQRSCKPTSIDFACPVTQQCHPLEDPDCSKRTCPPDTKCVMVECTGAYCSPEPRCLGSSGYVDQPSTARPTSSRPTFPPPFGAPFPFPAPGGNRPGSSLAPPQQRPSNAPFPSFPVTFPVSSNSTTASTTTTTTTNAPTSGTTSSSSSAPTTTTVGATSASTTPTTTNTLSSAFSEVSSTGNDLTSSASSNVPSVTTTGMTQAPSSSTMTEAVASAAALTSEKEPSTSFSGDETKSSSSSEQKSTTPTTPSSTTLEYLESSSTGSSAGSASSSAGSATPTMTTSAGTTTAREAEEEEGDDPKCSGPCPPGTSCTVVAIQGCTFSETTMVCNFEAHCVPDALPKCKENTCSVREACVVEGKGCRNVTLTSWPAAAAVDAPLEVRCGPQCYEPIFGDIPTSALTPTKCGRSDVICKRDEVCAPIVLTTCNFNAEGDLECDYTDQCVKKVLGEACKKPDTSGCNEDEHCVLEILEDCPQKANNPNITCPPQVQCYGLPLDPDARACASFACENGDTCTDMATKCGYDADGDLECTFEDACVPPAVERDCDKDVGCAKDETCVLHQVQCITDPCGPVPRCLKKVNPNATHPLVADPPSKPTAGAGAQCGIRACKLNEYCAKVTSTLCSFRESPNCTFYKQCVPRREPSCRDALCPFGTVCVNQKADGCDETSDCCLVTPKCIFLKEPSLTDGDLDSNVTLSSTPETPVATSEGTASTSSGSGTGSTTGETTAANTIQETKPTTSQHQQSGSSTSETATSPSSPAPVDPVQANQLPAGSSPGTSGGTSSPVLCGKGKTAKKCDETSELCQEVAVICIPAPQTGKLDCRYEDRCIRKDAPSCLTVRCSDGRHCVMREVRCATQPCDPVPECVRRADFDVNPRIADAGRLSRVVQDLFIGP